jgi:hypothetical protein
MNWKERVYNRITVLAEGTKGSGAPDPTKRNTAKLSRKYAGHKERMVGHMKRIRKHMKENPQDDPRTAKK